MIRWRGFISPMLQIQSTMKNLFLPSVSIKKITVSQFHSKYSQNLFILKQVPKRNVQASYAFHTSLLDHAKNKDKKKDKGKAKIDIDERILSEVLDIEKIKKNMQYRVDSLKEEYIKNVTLRSAGGGIENIKINFEGKDYSLYEVSQVSRKNPKVVIINMVAFPQMIPIVIQALQKSSMNLNPQQDGTTIAVPLPRITTEHREKLAKNASSLFIKCRDAIKDVQNKEVKSLKNQESLSKDLSYNVQQQLNALASIYISAADKLLQAKLKELNA